MSLLILCTCPSTPLQTGYDKGGSRLVNEDAVHLVDNGIVELPLGKLLYGVLHVVSQ